MNHYQPSTLALRSKLLRHSFLAPLAALVLIVVLPMASGFACNIPVFRYALENWQPDAYKLLIVHRGSLSPDQDSLLKTLSSARDDASNPANVEVFDVDLEGLESAEDETSDLPALIADFAKLKFKDAEMTTPTIFAYYPQPTPGIFTLGWQGVLSSENVKRLVDSKARREVAKRLTDGESAVWVLIKIGDKEKDDRAVATMEEQLKLMNSKIKLPQQDLIEAEEEFREDNPIELRVDFSMIQVSRTDPDEQHFISLLLGSEPDLVEFDEPIVLPIFGRGRTHFALIGKGINEDTIEDSCSFICGACSCQVKQQNPGIDMLMAFDWSSKIVGSAMKQIELPELTGIGNFVDDAESGAGSMGSESGELDASPSQTSNMIASASTAGSSAIRVEPDLIGAANSSETPSTATPSAETLSSAKPSAKEFERSLLTWVLGIVVSLGVIVGLVSVIAFRRKD